MHSDDAGGRKNRPSADSSKRSRLTIGLRRLRNRATLSNAVGYSPRDAPRNERNNHTSRNRHHNMENLTE